MTGNPLPVSVVEDLHCRSGSWCNGIHDAFGHWSGKIPAIRGKDLQAFVNHTGCQTHTPFNLCKFESGHGITFPLPRAPAAPIMPFQTYMRLITCVQPHFHGHAQQTAHAQTSKANKLSCTDSMHVNCAGGGGSTCCAATATRTGCHTRAAPEECCQLWAGSCGKSWMCVNLRVGF